MLDTLRSLAQSLFSRNPLGVDHNYFYDDIIAYLNQKIKENRNDVQAYLLLGKLLRLKGEAHRAFKLHANLLSHPKLNKQDSNTLYLEIGFDALAARLDDFGIEHFEKALLSRQTAPMAHYGLYKAYDLKGDIQQAEKHLEILVKQKHAPQSILLALYLQHLNVQAQHNTPSQYLSLSEKAMLIDSKHVDVQRHHVQALCANKFYEEALNRISDFLPASPYTRDLLSLAEDIFYQQDRYSEFEYQLSAWIKHIEKADIHLYMAKILHKKKKLDQAKKHIHQAFCLDAKNPYIFLTAIQCNLSLDDLEQFKSKLPAIQKIK